MSAHLEAIASQAVFSARLFERAVHSSGTWTIRWGQHRAKTMVVRGPEGVVFYASFPAAAEWSAVLPQELILEEDGQTVAVRPCGALIPSEGRFNVAWTVGPTAVTRELSVQ